MNRALQVLGGLAAGLVLGEGMCRLWDGNAFPHVNLFVADPKVGVRLMPGGRERIAFGGNPATTLRVNAEGYRGGDWGPPSDGEVVVIGDSQVLGLGVEEDETASAVLATKLGRPVRNAGVPTWGPPEYLAVADELVAARHPKTVVVVLNFANDLFEVDTPDTRRHAVWDGWAVRIETAPAAVTEFPGRRWLMAESHLVWAVRKAMWTEPEDWSRGVKSEGTWERVAKAAAAAPAQAAVPVDESAVAAAQREASEKRARVEGELEQLYIWAFGLDDLQAATFEAAGDHALPGDIVSDHFAEEARSVAITAAELQKAAELRRDMAPKLRRWVEEHPKAKGDGKLITDVLDRREKLDAELASLATEGIVDAAPRSPLAGFVRTLRDHVEAGGAELVVVALPLDVQVSAGEWAKYGAPPIDMTSSRALLTDLVADAERLGVRALDPTDALAAAEPGAFLDKDIHLSAKGQAVLGDAIAATLAAPAPRPLPGPGLPAERSRVPTVAEVTLHGEPVAVAGADAHHCATLELREWLLVDCTPDWRGRQELVEEEGFVYPRQTGEASRPRGVAVREGEEALVGGSWEGTRLLAPLVPGRPIRADFRWSDRAAQLAVTWDGDAPKLAFVDVADPLPAVPRPAGAEGEWLGDPAGACAATYPDDVAARLDCAAGTRGHLPTCPEGEANAGSGGLCHAICDGDHPCAHGTCADWQGGRVCL